MTKEEIINELDEYFFKQLQANPLPPYHVYTWSRDCDMCESSDVRTYMSYITLIQSYASYRANLEWAEGPSSWEIVEPQPDHHSTRDRVQEAYENGRGDSIYV